MLKLITCIFVLSSLLSSCELFGGSSEDSKGRELVWRLENQQENLTVSTKPAIDGNQVYFIQDAHLKAYTLEEGNRQWSNQICQQGRTCDYSRTIVQTDALLFIDQGFDIQAHNKTSGARIWETEITNDTEEVSGIGSPIMSQDEQYLYAGRKGYVLQVRKSDGIIAQRFELDRLVPEGITQGSTEPIIFPHGDKILYVPTSYWDPSGSYPEESSGGNVFAFNTSTGDMLWERQITITTANPYPDVPGDSLTSSPNIYDAEGAR